VIPAREILEQRIAELRAEFAAGEARIAQLDAQAQDVRHTLLRISGAIQALEEIIAIAEGETAPRTFDVVNGRVAE
jgi:prefoldin subunit 5